MKKVFTSFMIIVSFLFFINCSNKDKVYEFNIGNRDSIHQKYITDEILDTTKRVTKWTVLDGTYHFEPLYSTAQGLNDVIREFRKVMKETDTTVITKKTISVFESVDLLTNLDSIHNEITNNQSRIRLFFEIDRGEETEILNLDLNAALYTIMVFKMKNDEKD